MRIISNKISGIDMDAQIYSDFQIEIYRLKGNKVLLRASVLREKKSSFKFIYRIKHQHHIIGYDRLNKLLNGFLPEELINLSFFGKDKGDIIAIEYVYDLNNKQAKAAYNDVVNPDNWEVSDLKIINPLRRKNDSNIKAALKLKLKKSRDLINKGNAVQFALQSQTNSGIITRLLALVSKSKDPHLSSEAKKQAQEDEFFKHAYFNLNIQSYQRKAFPISSHEQIQSKDFLELITIKENAQRRDFNIEYTK